MHASRMWAHTVAAAAVAAALTVASGGCTAGRKQHFEEGGTTTTGIAGSGGGTGGTGGAIGGSGGQGGEGGVPWPCGIDCSTIQTDACHLGQCNTSTKQCQIVTAPDDTSCDDGLFCTVEDACKTGQCEGGPANDCGNEPEACTVITCDEAKKECKTEPSASGTPCNPDDACQLNAKCTNGLCIGTPNDCFYAPMPDECHVPKCNSITGKCDPVPGNEGQPCVDPTDLCAVGRTCANGVCQGGTPVDCSYLTKNCDMGVCDKLTGKCNIQAGQNGQPCDDLSACTTGEKCNNGKCEGGAPVTNCENKGDGCCPTNCNETTDIDCAIQPSCLAIKTSVPASTTGVYTIDPDSSGPIPQTQVYCDMDQDLGGWTLVARFANQDTANWMLDSGEWWYTLVQETGQTTSRSVNGDMISRAFWTVKGTELRLSRTDNPNDAGLLVTTGSCLGGKDFRTFITAFGNFQNGVVWGSDSVAGTCAATLAGNYAATNGFQKATCTGTLGAPNSISFWADYSAGDGAVMMIGGGGSACARADHGIGVTEANAASFNDGSSGEDDFGYDTSHNDPYALNLWVR